jgi:protein SCO1/2
MNAQIGDALARLNAGLNSASFVLLLLGWLNIRQKRIERHRKLMTAAFVTSALFLISYLTRFAITGAHHIAAGGWVKATYLGLLFSHMVLAALAVPLILRALFLGLKGRYDAHRKIARITFPIWAYVSLTGVVVYALLYHVVGTAEAARPDVRLPLPAFTLTDERSQPFGLADMKGKVWVADFVFTTCPTVCPKLTKKMATVQERTRPLGDSVHLLTITVDPENDTPDKLAAYAKQYGADPQRWRFLTGSLAQIEGAVMNGFKIAMGKQESSPGSGLMTIFHGEKFVVIDRAGNIRGYYDADDEGTADLLREVESLARGR